MVKIKALKQKPINIDEAAMTLIKRMATGRETHGHAVLVLTVVAKSWKTCPGWGKHMTDWQPKDSNVFLKNMLNDLFDTWRHRYDIEETL